MMFALCPSDTFTIKEKKYKQSYTIPKYIFLAVQTKLIAA